MAQQDIEVIFSETFDGATSTEPWPYVTSRGWYDSDNITLEEVDGRGKVMKINHLEGVHNSQSGLADYRIPLDSSYRELYLSFEYYIPEGFDAGMDDGYGGGKFFAGFAGGSSSKIPNNDRTEDDGWLGMFMFHRSLLILKV